MINVNISQFVDFLQLWLHEKQPEDWSTKGALLIDGGKAYRFFKEYEKGVARCDGTQPWLPDVFGRSEKIFFQSVSGFARGLNYNNAKKMVAALNRFQEVQVNLLRLEGHQPLTTYITLKSYLKNLRTEAPFTSQRWSHDLYPNICEINSVFSIVDSCEWKYLHFCLVQHDSQAKMVLNLKIMDFRIFIFCILYVGPMMIGIGRVAYAGVELDDKKKQSQLCLSEGTTTALRNRTQLLMQTFSISRSAEGMSWSFCDGWLFTYSRNLPGMGPTDMVACYLVQCFEKQRSVSSWFLNIFDLFSDFTFCNDILHLLREICNNDYK